MNYIKIEIIDDLEQCKRWGYDEPVLSISSDFSSHILQSSRVCMYEIKLIMKEIERRRTLHISLEKEICK